MKRFAIGLGAVCVPLLASPAVAEPVGYSLALHAPSGCPSVTELRDQIERRSQNLRLTSSGPLVRVDVGQQATGYYEARTLLPNGEQRLVRALACNDTLAAAAFIIVVALDPEFAGHPPAPAEPSSPVTPAAARAEAPPRIERRGQPSRSSTPVQDEARRTVQLGAEGALSGALSPGLMPMLGASVETRRERSLFALGFRGTLLAGRHADELEDGRSVTFDFLGAALDACPVGAGPLLFCVGLEAGDLIVHADEQLSVGTRHRVWLAGLFGLSLRVPLARRWSADLSGGALLPITRDRFVLELVDGSRELVHEPAFSGRASLGVGYALDP